MLMLFIFLHIYMLSHASASAACDAKKRCGDNSFYCIQGGKSTCTCEKGYVKGDDINYSAFNCEASCSDTGKCASKQHCVEHPKTSNLVCKCWKGYKKSNGSACEDIDECASGKNQCGKWKECENTVGSYTCQCMAGYEPVDPSVQGQNLTCRDIDECRNAAICPTNLVCKNLEGSHDCGCAVGHVKKGDNCEDMDECQESGSCSPGHGQELGGESRENEKNDAEPSPDSASRTAGASFGIPAAGVYMILCPLAVMLNMPGGTIQK